MLDARNSGRTEVTPLGLFDTQSIAQFRTHTACNSSRGVPDNYTLKTSDGLRAGDLLWAEGGVWHCATATGWECDSVIISAPGSYAAWNAVHELWQ